MLSISSALRDDPRFGMQRLSLDVNGPMSRMPINRRASFDAERDGGLVRRKAPSMSPGRGIMSPAHQVFRPAAVRPQYNQVHALILTWSFHDLKTAPYTAQPDPDYISLEDETRRLRDTLRSYGYHVHEFLIPMVRSVEQLQSRLRQFCRYAADDTLLMVYYHGHGSLDDDNELVFSSHEHPDDPDWSAAAAADLYEALMTGDPYAHSRSAQVSQLLKKYERYRPVAEVKWDDIRTAVLGAPCDMLLVLDCCAAGGANLGHASWQPPPSAEGYTKHLFAACGFESSTSDDMTAALCDVLDEWVPPSPTPPASQQLVQQQQQQDGRQRSRSRDARAAPFLTTKRLHQIVEDRLQKDSAGSQPIFKQLLPLDPEQYITLPNLLVLQQQRQRDREVEWAHAVDAAKRRGYILA
ncbi:hypothetical protein B0T26DRAFT_733502 [Lasiosphaeria miniovina]|uniref:Peptidase C14 caspase domain-containing protein n=1 Tax=Lasiosphaeria miniovina TaxID=1954250 RepID=A0AA39ZUU1_9PEZI|nr:uncharacterized protein B0T26DRAFT_733502 [Lasiosphaeria miniovina]KAK0703977.1 hypothetical protein B0T26DRAFT_733502 [Lasiosphaeria miniovina]